MEAWRWTTNAARPSKWAPLSNGPFLTERVCKTDECTDLSEVKEVHCFLSRLKINTKKHKGVYIDMDLCT